jgi:5,10-methylenetetrahydromethanopterin reductase
MPRFGLSYGTSPNEPVARVAEVAKAAEDIGYDCLWLTDTLNNKDIYVSLTLALGATSKLLIGPGITSFITRHPAITGNAMANLNEVGQGRAVMGLGAGGDPHARAFGWKPNTIKELHDGIVRLRQQWRDGKYDHNGSPIQLPPAQIAPKILLASTKARMLQLAGQIADGVIVMGAGNMELIQWQLDRLNEGLRESGRSPESFTKDFWITMSASDNRAEAIDEVRPWAAAQCRLFSGWQDLPPTLERFRDQIEKIAANYEGAHHLSGKASHIQFVTDELATAIAVAGTGQECAERLQAIMRLGFDRITVALRSGKGGRIARMKSLMDDVLSHVTL